MSKVEYNQSGYIGSSMSVRAKEAYDNGEMPKSKWTKGTMLYAIEEWCDYNDRIYDPNIEKMTKKELFNKFFHYSSWHHTGKYANPTDFYSLNEDAVAKVMPLNERGQEILRQQKEKEEREKQEEKERDAYFKRHGYSPNSMMAIKVNFPFLVHEETRIDWRGKAEKIYVAKTPTGNKIDEVDSPSVRTWYVEDFDIRHLTDEWKELIEKEKMLEQNKEMERER